MSYEVLLYMYNLGPFKIIEVSYYCKFNIYMYIKYAVKMALHGTGSDSLELANSCGETAPGVEGNKTLILTPSDWLK